MKYTTKDLQVFIATYNRANYLKDTIDSFLNQTEQGFEIIILDNASTDNTPEVVKGYSDRNVKLARSEVNLGHKGNFERAQKMANKEFVMLFHDDDLLHPTYIEKVVKVLNQVEDISFVTCKYKNFDNPTIDNWIENNSQAIICESQKDYTSLLFSKYYASYSAAIYNTNSFKEQKAEEPIYGKLSDRPFLIDVSKKGKVVILDDIYVQYRCHPGQDTCDKLSGPFFSQYIALIAKYHCVLGDNIFSKYGRVYLSNLFRNIIPGLSWVMNKKVNFFRLLLIFNAQDKKNLKFYKAIVLISLLGDKISPKLKKMEVI